MLQQSERAPSVIDELNASLWPLKDEQKVGTKTLKLFIF